MGGFRVAVAAGAVLSVLVVSGCASTPQGYISGSSAAPPVSQGPDAESPLPSSSGSSAPLSSTPVQIEGWTYAMVRDLCVSWINAKPLDDPPIRYDFDTRFGAERYADAWNLTFPAVYTDPITGEDTSALSTCAISGSPDDYTVGESEFVGDAKVVEAELLP